jgi:hypothetical protein
VSDDTDSSGAKLDLAPPEYLSLPRYAAARCALARAHRVDEAKAIRDKAEAMRVYAKQAGDFEMQNWAAEIRLRAERRAGELLAEMAANGQRVGHDGARKSNRAERVDLKSLGVTPDQSSKWPLADMPKAISRPSSTPSSTKRENSPPAQC